jgi:hypothetical protein
MPMKEARLEARNRASDAFARARDEGDFANDAQVHL